jgi:hypothetical protein
MLKNIQQRYCDLYRDGGSIGLCFTAQGGQGYSWAEFQKGFSDWDWDWGWDWGPTIITLNNWIRRRRPYELLLQVIYVDREPTRNYEPPVIYLENCNSGTIIKRLSWQEAKDFIAPLSSGELKPGSPLAKLVEMIQSEGIDQS